MAHGFSSKFSLSAVMMMIANEPYIPPPTPMRLLGRTSPPVLALAPVGRSRVQQPSPVLRAASAAATAIGGIVASAASAPVFSSPAPSHTRDEEREWSRHHRHDAPPVARGAPRWLLGFAHRISARGGALGLALGAVAREAVRREQEARALGEREAWRQVRVAALVARRDRRRRDDPLARPRAAPQLERVLDVALARVVEHRDEREEAQRDLRRGMTTTH